MTNAPYMATETRLRRAKRGDTVHLPGCRASGRTLPWIWAEDKPVELVRALPWVKPCKVCDPFAVPVVGGEDKQQ
jgi:hypothetical protein